MMGDPYGYPYPGKPKPSGMPTQYQDTPRKLFEDIGPGEDGGDKAPLPGGLPGGMPGGAQQSPAPQPYAGMAELDRLLQQRRDGEHQRRLLVQALVGQQPQQGPAPYGNSPHPLDLPPPIAQA